MQAERLCKSFLGDNSPPRLPDNFAFDIQNAHFSQFFAERLCKSFLGDNSPPRLPDNFAFDVHHDCAWGCRGAFLPSRYNSSRAKCIRCHYCGLFFSPNKFIFHSHRMPTSRYVQPDAANFNSWRRHLKLTHMTARRGNDGSGGVNSDTVATFLGQGEMVVGMEGISAVEEEIIHAWEDVKAMFNGGTRKRYSLSIQGSSNSQGGGRSFLSSSGLSMRSSSHHFSKQSSNYGNPTTTAAHQIASGHNMASAHRGQGSNIHQMSSGASHQPKPDAVNLPTAAAAASMGRSVLPTGCPKLGDIFPLVSSLTQPTAATSNPLARMPHLPGSANQGASSGAAFSPDASNQTGNFPFYDYFWGAAANAAARHMPFGGWPGLPMTPALAPALALHCAFPHFRWPPLFGAAGNAGALGGANRSLPSAKSPNDEKDIKPDSVLSPQPYKSKGDVALDGGYSMLKKSFGMLINDLSPSGDQEEGGHGGHHQSAFKPVSNSGTNVTSSFAALTSSGDSRKRANVEPDSSSLEVALPPAVVKKKQKMSSSKNETDPEASESSFAPHSKLFGKQMSTMSALADSCCGEDDDGEDESAMMADSSLSSEDVYVDVAEDSNGGEDQQLEPQKPNGENSPNFSSERFNKFTTSSGVNSEKLRTPSNSPKERVSPKSERSDSEHPSEAVESSSIPHYEFPHHAASLFGYPHHPALDGSSLMPPCVAGFEDSFSAGEYDCC